MLGSPSQLHLCLRKTELSDLACLRHQLSPPRHCTPCVPGLRLIKRHSVFTSPPHPGMQVLAARETGMGMHAPGTVHCHTARRRWS